MERSGALASSIFGQMKTTRKPQKNPYDNLGKAWYLVEVLAVGVSSHG
jgi:hypothetical protein